MEEQIKYIHNKQIDRDKWDKYIKSSFNGRIYATSFFLDIFSPGWDAMVIDEGRACMPVTRNSKYGIAYVSQPIFLQQLGCFFADRAYSAFLPYFISKLAGSCRFIDIAMNETNELNLTSPDRRVRNMNNFILNLDISYTSLYNNYNTNTKRNISSARLHCPATPENPSPAEIVGLFIKNNKRRYPGIRSINYKRLQTILEKGMDRDLVIIKSCYSGNGKLIAAACFLRDFNRDIFFFSVNTPEGRRKGSMFMIVDDFIKENAGSNKALDFNGSMDPGVARFYRGFGSSVQTYQRLYINNLPFPLRLLKSSPDTG
ncbi:MAG: hypothetical protein ACFCUM_11055 [Bacteroidales bacterium]